WCRQSCLLGAGGADRRTASQRSDWILWPRPADVRPWWLLRLVLRLGPAGASGWRLVRLQALRNRRNESGSSILPGADECRLGGAGLEAAGCEDICPTAMTDGTILPGP